MTEVRTAVDEQGRLVVAQRHSRGAVVGVFDRPRAQLVELRLVGLTRPASARTLDLLARSEPLGGRVPTAPVPAVMLDEVRIGDLATAARRVLLPEEHPEFDFDEMADRLGSLDPSAFGFGRRNQFFAHLEQASAATEYERLSRRESKPTKALAEAMGLDEVRARNLVSAARRNGYLTTSGHGRAGGQATDAARELLERVSSALRHPASSGIRGKGKQ